ncbi:MAG: ABC transporter permease [Acidobacteria bacterium]|nr:ABC transporter permease [Acidobacteriota bacterium]
METAIHPALTGFSSWEIMQTFIQDLRFGLRLLTKNPGFTAVAVLTLALGIGTNTAVFSLVNEVLLRSLPVKAPNELILFRNVDGPSGRMSRAGENNGSIDPVTGRAASTSFSLLAFERFRDHHPALSDVFAYSPFNQINILIDGQPETNVLGQFVSGGYYNGLGVPAILGRTLTPEDDQASAEPVAVISHRYWQNRFGSDSGIIGKTIQVNKVPTTIIGVTPPAFAGAMQIGESADISVPLAHYARFQPDRGASRAKPWYWWVRVMGRLAPQATAAQARAGLEPIFQEAAREGWLAGQSLDTTPRDMPEPATLAADPGGQGENDRRRQYAQSLRILMGMVSLVLLAACANVANLLLARGAARRREIALRLALGASRARIVRQLLVESLLLAFLGAALGALLAQWSHGLLVGLRQFGGAPAVLNLPLDARVLGFTIAVTAITAMLFGLAPALQATRVNLIAEFQGGVRQLGAGTRSRLSRVLMVVQIALSLMLLISTGLFVRTLRNLQSVDPGFNPNQLALFRLDAVSAGYTQEQFAALQSRLQTRLESIPGVRAATYSRVPLLAGVRSNRRISVPGYTPPPGASMIFNLNGLAPNFLAAMEIPLLLGRGFTDHDAATGPKVAIVNQAFARKIFRDETAIGRRISFSNAPATSMTEIEIVGITRDAKYTGLREDAPPTIYVPATQMPEGVANYCVRTTGNPTLLFSAIRAAVRELDPSLPVLNLRTQEEQIARISSEELLFARLSGFFGLVTLALACIGLYGLMSFFVLHRTGEIGLRMALGALPSQVLRMILRESLLLVGVGVALGLLAAYVSSRFIQSMLFGLSPTDPLTYGSVALLLILVALLASWLPARRAARVEPMTALRSE